MPLGKIISINSVYHWPAEHLHKTGLPSSVAFKGSQFANYREMTGLLVLLT